MQHGNSWGAKGSAAKVAATARLGCGRSYNNAGAKPVDPFKKGDGAKPTTRTQRLDSKIFGLALGCEGVTWPKADLLRVPFSQDHPAAIFG